MIDEATLPSVDEISLGVIDQSKVIETLKSLPKNQKYTQFSDKDRLIIGKNASIYGNSSATQKFASTHKDGESTVRWFHSKYESSLNKVRTSNEITSIPNVSRGRPLMIRKLDKQVQEYLHIYRKKGGEVNRVVAVATA